MWAAATLFRNNLGGQVVCLTYPINGAAQFFMAFFNVYRKEFFQRLIYELSPKGELACIANHPVQAYRTPTKDGELLAVINPTDDLVEHVTWRIPLGAFTGGGWSVLGDDGLWVEIQPERTDGGLWTELLFTIAIPPLYGRFFQYRETSEN